MHQRQQDGEWTSTVGIRGGSVEVRSLGLRLAIDEVYRASAIR